MISLTVSDVLRVVFGLFIAIANITTVVTLLKCKKMAFQIRILTIQLAATDVITGLFVTMVGLNIPNLSAIMCRGSYHIQTVISYMACFTVTTMSFDRFLAVCIPLRYRDIVTARRVKYFVIVLWIVSLLLSLLTLRGIKTAVHDNCHYVTIFNDDFKQHAAAWWLVLLLNIAFYGIISQELFCRRDHLESSRNCGGTLHMNQQKRILRKISVITIVFVLTYLPFNVVLTILIIDYDNRDRYMTTYFITMFIWLTNSILNPCVYVWQYPECREKLLCCCTFWKKGHPTETGRKLCPKQYFS